MPPDARQHGGVRQGVHREKVARTEARAFQSSTTTLPWREAREVIT
jgi:hypothetical protein